MATLNFTNGQDECCKTMVGSAPGLLEALETARRLARTKLPILIMGETGTGKELLAQYVHRLSKRAHLVDVDCGALPADLIEALLFGHRRGAFTGATESSDGLIALSDGGTLLLDELGSLPIRGQAKLLRALETGEVRRVGGDRSKSVDFRLVATIQGDVAGAVDRGEFRLDLLQRVAGAVIRLPPLSERGGDIIPLARHFASEVGVALSSGAEELLRRRSWPGNVRQLRWTVLRAAHLEPEVPVGRQTMLRAIEIGPERILDAEGDAIGSQRGRLAAVCRAHGGDPDQIADALDVSRATVYRRVNEVGLDLSAFRDHDSARDRDSSHLA